MKPAKPGPWLMLALARRVAALLVIVAPAFGADEAPVGPIIELPKFVVTDSRELPPPEAWRYAEIPGFEILTNASDRTTRRLIKDFELFKEALSLIWPIPNRAGVPTSLILSARGAKFDGFVPAGTSRADRSLASIFLKNQEQTAIVIDLASSTLNLLAYDTTNDSATGTDSSLLSVDHDKQLYREYVHYLLSKSEPRFPAWFEEGMAQIIMAMKVDRKYIVFGKIEDPNTISAQAGAVAAMNALTAADDPTGLQIAGAPAEDRDFNVALQRRPLVPFPKFFAVASDSPEAINPLGNNVWAKQCYAFVHLGLYGHNRRFQKPFATFLLRLSKEPVSEELFKECFGMDYKKMLNELRSYIDFTNYKHQEYTIKGDGLVVAPPLVLRDATQSEVGRIKGEALALGGHSAAARAELIAPYIRGERDPQLLAALGLQQHATGQDDHARKFLEAATTAKVVRPTAYLELARLRYADALAKPGTAGGEFSATQSAQVLDLLLVARKQPPPTVAVYELIADTWAHSAAKPKRDDVGLLVEGVQLFPHRLRLMYQTAVLSVDAGMNDVATSLVDYALKVAPDVKTRELFEKLKAALPAPELVSISPGPAPVNPKGR